MARQIMAAPVVGQEFAGTAIPVTQATIDEYGDLNGDNDIIHYDKAYAQARGFRDAIAHGLMSLSYLAETLRDQWGLGWLTTGSIEIRWTGPVCPGDTITPKGVVSECAQADGGWRVTAEVWCENQLGERVLRGQAGCLIRSS